MKYEIGTKVIALDRKCLVVATKERPHKPKIDPYNRTEIYPENDYLLYLFKEVRDGKEDYLGTLDLFENQITKENG